MDSKNNGIHPLREPLILKEDNTPEDRLAEVNHDKENDHDKLLVRKNLTGNTERDRTRDLKYVNFRPKQEDKSPNEFAKDGMDGKTSSSEVGARKVLFRILTLKSRWFRQEPASSVEKSENARVITERNREAAKTDPINVPLRKAASCDNLSCLLSSPKDGDFECTKNITKYLEVQEKLKKAEARIAYLENQRSEPTDEEDMMTQDIKSASATQDQEIRVISEDNERRTERDVKIKRNVQLNQVLSFFFGRWFRQEPASSVEKSENARVITERNREAAKTDPISVPLRKAISCDNLSCLLSSPKDGDFECTKNITKYLEVQEKLKKAEARIAYLENQRSEPTDEEDMMTQDIKSASATQDQEIRVVREDNERRTERDVKIKGNVQLNQVLSFQEKSKKSFSFKSFSLKKGGRASSTSRLLDGPDFTPLINKDPGDSTDDEVFINETERWLKISHNPQAFTTPDDDRDDGYVFMSPPSICGHQLPKTVPPVSCVTARNDVTAVKEGEDHSYDVDKKRALRETILEVPWTEEERTELNELVRYEMNQRKKRQMVSYTNWPLNGRQSNLLAEQSGAHSSSHQEENRRKEMVSSENLNQQAAANEQLLQGQQTLINDPQLLVRRSLRRRPVPTPRRRRASLQASCTASNLEEML